jgi:transcriptional regulator with XRE-family HTH domain
MLTHMSGPLTRSTATRVRAVMKSLGFSQQALAEQTGIPQQTLSRRLRLDNPTPFNTNELELVAAALGVTVEQLVAVEADVA